MGLARPFNHPARQLTDDSRTDGVCSICQQPVNWSFNRLRHTAEAFPADLPPVTESEAFHALVHVIRDALDDLPPWEVTDDDRARIAAQRIFEAGAARTRRSSWRPSRLRRVA
ncbi:hypothetical protein [Actinomadura violacea]|uniref:Uncharacterized protein n=1 Tax=Actinomadura violacea TaxID=2819934 RepID=A0ABS3RZ63_9ACTN|nr:hypothetical protein [Actinomadura violacea]MBO2461748.1 hypothetical protein [Actinomadura violacea]